MSDNNHKDNKNLKTPKGTVLPISNILRKINKDFIPQKVSKESGAKEVLRQAASSMFGDKSLLEGPMQKAVSRNHCPLNSLSKLKFEMSEKEKEELQPILDSIIIGLRKAKSTVDSKYSGYGARDGIIPPMLKQCYDYELNLWEAEEKKIQEYLKNPPEYFKAHLNKLGITEKELQEPIFDPHLIDVNALVPKEVYERISKLGLLKLRVPREYSGFGLNQKQYDRVLRELVRTHSGTVEAMISAHSTIGAAPLLRFGTEEQKNKYIPLVAKGEFLCVFSLTEPGSGTDADAKMTTIAKPSSDGRKYFISGAKIYATNFHRAGLMFLIAKIDDGSGILKPTAFLVELPFKITDTEEEMIRKIKELSKKDRAGGRIHACFPQDMMMIRGSNQAYYELDNFEVSSENILGEIGAGMLVAYGSLNEGRAAFGAACAEAAKLSLEETVIYAAQREIFDMYGGTLADLPYIKKLISEMAVNSAAINAASDMTSAIIDKFGKNSNIIAECAAIKALASKESNKIVHIATEILGGNGTMRGLGIERNFRDAWITKIVEGADPAMLQFHLGAAAKPANSGIKAIIKGRNPIGAAFRLVIGMFIFETGALNVFDAFALQIKTKILGLKNGLFAMKYGNKALLQQNTVMEYADQNVKNYTHAAVLLKLKDQKNVLSKKEKIALKQCVKNSGLFNSNAYPNKIAEVYIEDARKHIKEALNEEEGLVRASQKSTSKIGV